jgi:hypothetical protein
MPQRVDKRFAQDPTNLETCERVHLFRTSTFLNYQLSDFRTFERRTNRSEVASEVSIQVVEAKIAYSLAPLSDKRISAIHRLLN